MVFFLYLFLCATSIVPSFNEHSKEIQTKNIQKKNVHLLNSPISIDNFAYMHIYNKEEKKKGSTGVMSHIHM